MLLGAGRSRADAAVDPAAGIVLHRREGDQVAAGEVLAELHHDPATADLRGALELLATAVMIAPEPPPRRRLVIDRLC